MGDQHFFVTSVLIEDDEDIERFRAVLRDRFRAVYQIPPSAAPLAFAMYDKDFDGITSAIELIDTIDALSGILRHDVHIAAAWEPYGRPERRTLWRVPGRDGDGLRLPEIPDQDDAIMRPDG
jgi:hypothetical protein